MPPRLEPQRNTPPQRGLESSSTARTKRLNIALSGRTYADLTKASANTNRSMTDLVRLGISLVKVVLEAEENDQRVYIATPDGSVVKQIILP